MDYHLSCVFGYNCLKYYCSQGLEISLLYGEDEDFCISPNYVQPKRFIKWKQCRYIVVIVMHPRNSWTIFFFSLICARLESNAKHS